MSYTTYERIMIRSNGQQNDEKGDNGRRWVYFLKLVVFADFPMVLLIDTLHRPATDDNNIPRYL